MFLAPPEVHHSILDVNKKCAVDTIDSADVIKWCLEQTCQATENNRPLWVSQGLGHWKRQSALNTLLKKNASIEDALRNDPAVMRFLTSSQDKESQTLEELYSMKVKVGDVSLFNLRKKDLEHPIVRTLLHEWDLIRDVHRRDSSMHEEYEREVAVEIEQERQVQKTEKVDPASHQLHEDIVQFVRSGKLRAGALNTSVLAAFGLFHRTSAKSYKASIDTFPPGLLATTDFTRTVSIPSNWTLDEYLRPVNWVLRSRKSDTPISMILSPYEINELLPKIWKSTKVTLSLYSPHIAKTMVSFGALDFYNLPSQLDIPTASLAFQRDLGLFSGSLYLTRYKDYRDLCLILGVINGIPHEKGQSHDYEVHSDGFVPTSARNKMAWPVESPFTSSPLPFLKALLGIRRRGQDFSHSHLGRVVHGEILTEDEFDH